MPSQIESWDDLTPCPSTLNTPCSTLYSPTVFEETGYFSHAPKIEPAASKTQFWITMIAVMISVLCAALDLTCITIALPTIVEDLGGKGSFVWVTTAFTLLSTAFLPWSAGFACIFGRQPVMIFGLVALTIGSVISGAAQSMPMLIAGRAVMGLGSGLILALADIIVADLVPLQSRGLYLGMLEGVWAFGSCIGPIIGGLLANINAWRYLFYLNIPVCAIAIIFCLFMRLKAPKSSWKEKVMRMDFLGNSSAIAGTVGLTYGLTVGGVTSPWNSVETVASLTLGLVALVAFVVIEIYFADEPTLPFKILFRHRNSQIAALHIFLQGAIFLAFIYFFPFYLQASFGFSPLRSAVLVLVTSTLISPPAILVGLSVDRFGKYVPQNWLGWIFLTLGLGLCLTLDENSSPSLYLGLQVLPAIGIGMGFPCPLYTLLSPLTPKENAPALATLGFLRSWGSTIGFTLGGAILNNRLSTLLPEEFLQTLSGEADIAYSSLSRISGMSDVELRQSVRAAYAGSVRGIWMALLALSGVALLLCIALRNLKLDDGLDSDFSLKEGKEGRKEGKRVV